MPFPDMSRRELRCECFTGKRPSAPHSHITADVSSGASNDIGWMSCQRRGEYNLYSNRHASTALRHPSRTVMVAECFTSGPHSSGYGQHTSVLRNASTLHARRGQLLECRASINNMEGHGISLFSLISRYLQYASVFLLQSVSIALLLVTSSDAAAVRSSEAPRRSFPFTRICYPCSVCSH